MSVPPYPNPAYPNPQYGVPQPRPIAAPGSVQGAFGIYLITALLSLVGIVITLTSDIYDRAINEAANAGAVSGTISADQIVSIAKTVTIVVGVLFLALYLFFAFKMRAGRNWARIVLTVLSGLSILSVANTGSVTVNNRVYSSTMSLVSGWVGAALAVLAIVLMYLSASNQYFREVKAAQQRLG